MSDKIKNEEKISRRFFLQRTAKAGAGLLGLTLASSGVIKLVEGLNRDIDSPYNYLVNRIDELRRGKTTIDSFRTSTADILANLIPSDPSKGIDSVWINTGKFIDRNGNPDIDIVYDSTKPKEERLGLNSVGAGAYVSHQLAFLRDFKIGKDNFYFTLNVHLDPISGKPGSQDYLKSGFYISVSPTEMFTMNTISWYLRTPQIDNSNLIMSISQREDLSKQPFILSKTTFSESGGALGSGTEFQGTTSVTFDKKGNIIDKYSQNSFLDPVDLPRKYQNFQDMLMNTKSSRV